MSKLEIINEDAKQIPSENWTTHFIAEYLVCVLLLCASTSLWLVAIRAPLWQDETLSFALIKGGFWQIFLHQDGPFVPAFPFILWSWTKAAGTSELALRILPILAMLGAVYFLYRAAWELFDRDIAVIVAIVFCLHPIVILESIDVRPYAFVMLATTTAIFALVRLRQRDSKCVAALFGVSAAVIVWFHLLSIVILPALAICFLLSKPHNTRAQKQQFGIALAAFCVAFLAVVPGFLYMLRSRGIHVVYKSPSVWELILSAAPVTLVISLIIVCFGAFLAAGARLNPLQRTHDAWRFALCVSTALVPLLTLFFVSTLTPLHIFAERYRLIAVPGIALCWGLILNTFRLRWFRLAFCVCAVALTAHYYLRSESSHHHLYTWRYALEVAEKSASRDNAPVVICSDLPEADYWPMPTGDAVKDSTLFPNLTYYRLSAPVVPLPRALNAEATRLGSAFLQDAERKSERFLAMGNSPSHKTLDWLTQQTSGVYAVHNLGTFEGVKVLEFVPVEKASPTG